MWGHGIGILWGPAQCSEGPGGWDPKGISCWDQCYGLWDHDCSGSQPPTLKSKGPRSAGTWHEAPRGFGASIPQQHHVPPNPPPTPPALPAPLDLADVLDEGTPVESSRLTPHPTPQLLPVHLQEIGGHDLLEVIAGAQQLIDGGARAHVDERAPTDLTWGVGGGPTVRHGMGELSWMLRAPPPRASVSPPLAKVSAKHLSFQGTTHSSEEKSARGGT